MPQVHQDESDGQGHSPSVLKKIRDGFRRVLPGGRQSRPTSSGSKRDSAVSTSSELSYVSAERLELTMAACRCNPCVHTENQCLEDHDKFPADGTVIHVVSQQLGLLRVTEAEIETEDSDAPVYKVDCKGQVGQTNTNIVLYMFEASSCVDCKRFYLHVLDPKGPSTGSATAGIPLDEYTYRLCRYKQGDSYVLAAHKAPHAIPKFGSDPDALIEVCYHVQKGGMVTLQANSSSGQASRLWGMNGDGEVCSFPKSKFQGFCTNPFTLFYMYDEVEDNADEGVGMKRMNGEV